MNFASSQKSRAAIVGCAAIAAALFFSCTDKKPTEPVFVINATSSQHGSVTPLGSVPVKPGGSQSFLFVPDSGYSVVTVRIDGVPVSPVTSFTFSDVRANHYVFVSFSHVYQITSSAGAHGQITPVGTITVPEGESISYTITPDFGYRITDVIVDGSSVGVVTTYSFSNITTDHSITASFALIPFVLSSDNGLYYRGSLGNSILTPQLAISATDSAGVSANQWINLIRVTGDGALGADSLMTDANGKIAPSYTFSGVKGNAQIRALWPGKDTLDVFLRASVLEPGESAQGQFVLVGDTYKTVKALNGIPERVDVDPNFWLTYAVYETALGVVVILNDVDQNEVASDFETVQGIIVNGGFAGTFAGGLGINSTVGAMDSSFGPADTTYFDLTPPAAWVYVYRSLGITFYANQATPRRIFEIHVSRPSAPAPAGLRRPAMPQGAIR